MMPTLKELKCNIVSGRPSKVRVWRTTASIQYIYSSAELFASIFLSFEAGYC